MQRIFRKNEEIPAGLRLVNGIFIKQPYADLISEGKKTAEIRSRRTKYRGEIIICSSKTPVIDGRISGHALSVGYLYDCVDSGHITPTQARIEVIPAGSYGWLITGIRKLKPIETTGQLGIVKLYFDVGDIRYRFLDKIYEEADLYEYYNELFTDFNVPKDEAREFVCVFKAIYKKEDELKYFIGRLKYLFIVNGLTDIRPVISFMYLKIREELSVDRLYVYLRNYLLINNFISRRT